MCIREIEGDRDVGVIVERGREKLRPLQ
jgi:hypothetical protein